MKLLYHASPTGGISVLEPRVSNHGKPLIYFSEKRENVLVYLSNAVEKYCRETGFEYNGTWQKWGPYGFTTDGKLQLQEYYPNAIQDTYDGVQAYIYTAEKNENMQSMNDIPCAYSTSCHVEVLSCEVIENAYDEIMEAEEQGLISIMRYEDIHHEMLEWIEHSIKKEYVSGKNHPEYRHFLRGKFSDIIDFDK